MSQSRGVLYLQWGERCPTLVQRSLASLRAVHPALPVHIHTLPDHATLLEKSAMLELSPFEETLYLDADTVVLDSLDFGFEHARRPQELVDPDVDVLSVAGVEHHLLRVAFDIPHTQVIPEAVSH